MPLNGEIDHLGACHILTAPPLFTLERSQHVTS